MQQHLLHDGVAEPGALPVSVLSEDVPGHLQLGAGQLRPQRRHRLHCSS